MSKNNNTIKITVDGRDIICSEDAILAQVLKAEGIRIPTPCYHPGVKRNLVCKLCLVEIAGIDKLRLACMCKVKNGMNITTNSERIFAERRRNLQVMFDKHYEDADCDDCIWNGECELVTLGIEYGIITEKKNRA